MSDTKIPLEYKVTVEKRAIKLVMLGDVLLAVLGLSFFYLTDSLAILMDGVYPFIDLLAGLLTLRVVSLMAQQASQAQPFGYAIFEPVLNFIKGVLILLVILVAFYASVEAILHGGRHIDAHIAVYYSVISSVLGFAMAYGLYRMNQTAQSSLIHVDLQGWLTGGVLSIAVGLSFGVAIWMEAIGHEEWVPYTDPVVILILIVLMLPIPLKILKENGLQIIGRTDDDRITDFLKTQVHQVFDAVAYLDIKIRYLQAGRMMYVQVYLQLDEQARFDLHQQDDYRDRLYHHLKQTYDYLSLDVIYTAQPIWVMRSIGEEHAEPLKTEN
ncbi:MAG: cation diffusion facilitator family transporter [Hydrogenovibrio sp.]